MPHNLISIVGLGLLGIDPITAIYLLSMAVQKDRKVKISLFMLSFMGFSILIGTAAALVFGASAVDFLQSITMDDNSPVWAILQLVLSLVILMSIFYKRLKRNKKETQKRKKVVEGSAFKYIAVGFVFAVTSFTDPTYYAVILLGGETNNLFLTIIFFTIWFLVSQFMAVVVYIANQANLLNKLTAYIEKLKVKKMRTITNVIFGLLIIIAVLLIMDSGFYLFNGKYLF